MQTLRTIKAKHVTTKENLVAQWLEHSRIANYKIFLPLPLRIIAVSAAENSFFLC